MLATFQMRHERRRHDAGRAGRADARRPTWSGPARPMAPGPRSGTAGLQRRHRPRARPDRDDHDRHGRRTSLPSRKLQIWRLSDLRAAAHHHPARRAAGDEGLLTAEPRVLADGRTVLVSTFNCGLYLMEGLETESPSARLVASFPRKAGVVLRHPGRHGPLLSRDGPGVNAVVSLDISDPEAPREVGRLTLGPATCRTGSPSRPMLAESWSPGTPLKQRVLIARSIHEGRAHDRRTFPGRRTRREPGFRLDNKTWPHGGDSQRHPARSGVQLPLIAGRPR